MDPSERKVYVSSNLKKVLTNAYFRNYDENNLKGYIAGWHNDQDIFSIMCSTSSDLFLVGLDIVGLFCQIENDNPSENELCSISKRIYSELQAETDNLLIFFIPKKLKEEILMPLIIKSYSSYYCALSDIEAVEVDNIPVKLFRASGHIPVVLEASSDVDILKENIDCTIERLKTLVQCGVPAFVLENSNIILCNLTKQIAELNLSCKDLIKYAQNDSSFETNVKNKKKLLKNQMPINFKIYMEISGEAALENTVNHALVIHCQRREFQSYAFSLPLDILIVIQESSNMNDIYRLFLKALIHQLEQMAQSLLKYAEVDIMCPVPYHFMNEFWDLPITLIYPLDKTDEELEQYRRKLHQHLLLPLDQPYLRKFTAHQFSDKTIGGYLINPHIGLSNSGVTGGMMAIVKGRYTYHHYMQDHINDNGWGCAYRSLQTIISWFKFQGYTVKNIPTHKEIQQALVDIGDKPSSFVGSNKWIGSQEVSFCLDHFLKVNSKIIFVNSGAEIVNHARELLNHFQKQGTPVMIGGGVLAHTILGVDFNENTGDTKFLILDPHYTGSEDLNIIQNKGWCGWKGPNFWDQTTFYNLCLPQRPIMI